MNVHNLWLLPLHLVQADSKRGRYKADICIISEVVDEI